MNIIDRVQQYVDSLRVELEKIAPRLDGAVSQGTVKVPPAALAALLVQYPALKGNYRGVPVWVEFSITSDSSQWRAGQPTNKSTVTSHDYLNPWLQVHVFQPSPFVLRITPERTDLMTRFTRLIGLESRGLQLGWETFDERYFVECRSGQAAAEAYLRSPGVREKIEALDEVTLLRFEETYVKLVTSQATDDDHQAERIFAYIQVVSELAAPWQPLQPE